MEAALFRLKKSDRYAEKATTAIGFLVTALLFVMQTNQTPSTVRDFSLLGEFEQRAEISDNSEEPDALANAPHDGIKASLYRQENGKRSAEKWALHVQTTGFPHPRAENSQYRPHGDSKIAIFPVKFTKSRDPPSWLS